MSKELEAGATNCVVDCAEVRKGQRFIVVNEEGAVDPEVSEAILNIARVQGASVSAVWAPAIPKDRPDDIPKPVLDAYRDADVLIAHFPSLQREALHVHFPSETRVRVPNRAPRSALLASSWARFPYRVQRAVSHALDNVMAPGVRWRITSPSGTDISGVFAANDSVVCKAYFSLSDDNERARRNFPGGVHSPHASDDVNGMITVDYIDHHPGAGREPGDRLRLEIANNAVISLTGGTMAPTIRDDMTARTDGFLDSWHAGVNPRTFPVIARDANARAWFGYAHCSPKLLHFHWGRSHAHVNVGVINQSVWVGEQQIYRDGRLMKIEDQAVDAALRRAGLTWGEIAGEPALAL